MKILSEKIIPSKSFRLRRVLETEYGRITLDSIAVISAPPGKELTIDVRTYVNRCRLLCYHCTDTLDLLYEKNLADTKLMEYIALDYIKNPRGNFETTPEEMVNDADTQFRKELRTMCRRFRLKNPK